MRRFVAGVLVTLGVLAVAGQLALPQYYAGRTEDRLEQGGGSARVSIGAFPALTLLAGRGDSLEVSGSGLSFELEGRREDRFERLDGFGEVDLELEEVQAGPLDVEELELTRAGEAEPYELVMQASTTPTKLVEELGARAGGALGSLVGSLATEALPGGGRSAVPLELRAAISSEEGRTDVRDASGSVAGVPAGPLAEIVAGAVIERL